MRHPLDGVTVPLTTVMREPGVPSFASSEQQLHVLADAGVDNLMLFGSNGEGSLIHADRWGDYPTLVTRRWRQLRPDGAVMVNVSAHGTDEMLIRAALAAECEPDALVVSPPGYFRHTAEEIAAHVRAVEPIGLPVIVYNLPRVASPLDSSTYERLLETPSVVGVKDSSGDPAVLEMLIGVTMNHRRAEVGQGDERRALHALDAAAAGIVPGIANIAPRLATELVAAHRRGDRDAAERAQQRMTELTAIHAIHPGVPSIKAVLHRRGITGSATLARPLLPLSTVESEALERFVTRHDDVLVGS